MYRYMYVVLLADTYMVLSHIANSVTISGL